MFWDRESQCKSKNTVPAFTELLCIRAETRSWRWRSGGCVEVGEMYTSGDAERYTLVARPET
jgi:hypothetical protein